MAAAYTQPDLDAWTIPPFSVYDGIEGAWQDDDRTVSLWSHYHAIRVNTCLRITRARIRIFEWQLADVTPRGIAERTEAAAQSLAAAKAELAALEHRRDLLEAARVADTYAPTSWTWE
jgi:hypothetical protein